MARPVLELEGGQGLPSRLPSWSKNPVVGILVEAENLAELGITGRMSFRRSSLCAEKVFHGEDHHPEPSSSIAPRRSNRISFWVQIIVRIKGVGSHIHGREIEWIDVFCFPAFKVIG